MKPTKRILAASDTHGDQRALLELIRRNSPLSMLIFCGDGEDLSEELLAEAAGSSCEVHIVRGNNDWSRELPSEKEFMIGPYRAFLTHGHRYGVGTSLLRLAEAASARGCSLAFFGHTHRPEITECCGVTCLNPGSLSYPRQFDRTPSFLLIEQEESGRLHFCEARFQ